MAPPTPTDDEQTWYVVGVGEINEGVNRIRVPLDLVDEHEVFRADDRIHWQYEQVVGTIVLSNPRLEESRGGGHNEFYKHVASVGLREIKSNEEIVSYRMVVPKKFFSDFVGQTEAEGPVPQKARLSRGELLFYAFHEEMREGPVRSCYLLTTDELEEIIPRSGDINSEGPGLDHTPQFI